MTCRPRTAGFTIKFYDTLEDFYLAEALEYVTAWRQAAGRACGHLRGRSGRPSGSRSSRLVNELELDLRHAHFWAMDEWVIDGREESR